ncbi:hypothetical protein POM88_011529 [Heracleum sosnowskyi]|uniref:Uncharacterized protein n=1 Tax=Heracleum sosnowskyi TaxID=360622 RepID=A0AAD8IWZ3_9APIA|nr:hypothetical protein POM88_011529 [Heracleum sosnowskyi]
MNCVSPLPQWYANNFSMHGLWPAKIDGKTIPVGGKTTPPISEGVFERVEASMDIWWACIDLQWKLRTDFWENEWIKHGQMGLWGQGDTGAESYFLDGIKARQKIDLLQILEKGKIAFNTEYTKKQVVDVLHSSLGVENVYLACSSRGKSYFLRELLICLNKTTHLYISCPPDNSPRGCSGTTFQIPVFH